MTKKTIFITAGGTGGHVFPALAVAKELEPDFDVVWIGATVGIENELVPKNGFKLERLRISGLRKKGWLKLFLMPFLLSFAVAKSIKLILVYRPDVVVGFGGYAAFPVSLAAWILRIPVIIHEQNSIAGLSNKILARLATYVLVAFGGVLPGKNTILVGNPVRADIVKVDPVELRYRDRVDGLSVLILGGSLGAKLLNDSIPHVLAGVKSVSKIIHQVGRGDDSSVVASYQELGISQAKVVKFIDDMADAYAQADLIISRSGASTVSEICAVGVATIFIPYPYAVDDHQRYNAAPLVANGAAFMLLQADFQIEDCIKLIDSLDREKCLHMALQAKKLDVPDSINKICQIIRESIQ